MYLPVHLISSSHASDCPDKTRLGLCSSSLRRSCRAWKLRLTACMPRLGRGCPRQPSTRPMRWGAASGGPRCSLAPDVSPLSCPKVVAGGRFTVMLCPGHQVRRLHEGERLTYLTSGGCRPVDDRAEGRKGCRQSMRRACRCSSPACVDAGMPLGYPCITLCSAKRMMAQAAGLSIIMTVLTPSLVGSHICSACKALLKSLRRVHAGVQCIKQRRTGTIWGVTPRHARRKMWRGLS